MGDYSARGAGPSALTAGRMRCSAVGPKYNSINMIKPSKGPYSSNSAAAISFGGFPQPSFRLLAIRRFYFFTPRNRLVLFANRSTSAAGLRKGT